MDTNELLQGARDALTVKRVFAEPYERNGVAVIAAAAVRGGGGGGGDTEGNGGGGFGLDGRPVGAYVIRDGVVRWEPAIDVTRLAVILVVALVILRGVVPRRRRRRRRS